MALVAVGIPDDAGGRDWDSADGLCIFASRFPLPTGSAPKPPDECHSVSSVVLDVDNRLRCHFGEYRYLRAS